MDGERFLNPLLNSVYGLGERDRTIVEKLAQRERAQAENYEPENVLDAARQQRVELTRGEMWEQPQAIQETLSAEGHQIKRIASALGSLSIQRIYIVGCGDSWAAAIAVSPLFEELLGIVCLPVQGLDFYYRPIVDKDTLVIGISSSGETARVVDAILRSKVRGGRTLALSNTAGSSVMSEAEMHLLIHAVRKGWPTQSTTATMAVLYQIALELARVRGYDSRRVTAIATQLDQVPDHISKILNRFDAPIADLAASESRRTLYFYAGAGPAYASALIGSAKVKECSPDQAIALPLEEFHHYVTLKPGDLLFLVAPRGLSSARAVDTAIGAHAMGGRVAGLVTSGDLTLEGLVDWEYVLPSIEESLAPLLFTIPLQLFAYHVAMKKFQQAKSLSATAITN